jgi:hypothetical protein
MNQVRQQNAMIDEMLEFYTKQAFKEITIEEDFIKIKIGKHIQKLSASSKLAKQIIISTLFEQISNSNRILKSILDEIEEEEEQQLFIPKHENEYRYKVSDAVKIYKKFIGVSIDRNTINNYTLPDSNGQIILPSVDLPNQHKSICESDLIEVFASRFGVLLEPEKIRKYHYKAPKK